MLLFIQGFIQRANEEKIGKEKSTIRFCCQRSEKDEKKEEN